MNYFTSTSKHIFFTHQIVASVMVMNKDKEEVVGAIIMEGQRVKKRIQTDVEELRVCKNESDRIDALRKWFGIVLDEKAQKGIVRTCTQIVG